MNGEEKMEEEEEILLSVFIEEEISTINRKLQEKTSKRVVRKKMKRGKNLQSLIGDQGV